MYQSRLVSFIPRRDYASSRFSCLHVTGKAFVHLSKEKVPGDIRAWTHSSLLSPTLFSPFQISRARDAYMRITFDNLERARVSRTTSLLSSSCFFFLFFPLPLFLSLLLPSRHTRGETGFREIFFSRPRFLDGDLMELKSFRDAHRCALYSHAARRAEGARCKNSLRAKKKSPDR